jgi:uncharacterized membrane protein
MNFTNFGIPNLFVLNDWELKKLLGVVLTTQLTLVGLIFLESSGFEIPIIRPLVGFVYLTFIPGFLILRVLRIHNLGSAESILYAVGLSLSSLMFLGLFANTVYPLLGISRPISLEPLAITLFAFVCILVILCYLRDRSFINYDYNANTKHVSGENHWVVLCFLPLIALFGVYFVNFYHINFFLVILLLVIATIPFLVVNGKIQGKFYPLCVYLIAISLLYHNSLFSTYLVEWADISFEYWYAKNVLENSIWDPEIESAYNSVISVTILAPIFSIILKLPLVWVFKAIYPLIFSFVSVGLYLVYKRIFNHQIAFLASFFFMSMFNFYTDMLGLIRQQIAELFLVLLVLLFIERELEVAKKSFLAILFGFSIPVSHYSIAYISLFIFISSWLLLFVTRNKSPFSVQFVLGFFVFTIAWFIYISGSKNFLVGTIIAKIIVSHLSLDFLTPETSQGMRYILMEHRDLVGYSHKLLHLASVFFITIGLFISLFENKKDDSFSFYKVFSLMFFVIASATIIVPYFAATLNTSRLYGITLLSLSPFCILGGKAFFERLIPAKESGWKNILAGFLSIFLLFNSGLMNLFFSENQISQSLNPDTSIRPVFRIEEITAATWSHNTLPSTAKVYSDTFNAHLLQMISGSFNPLIKGVDTREYEYPLDSYIFIGTDNIKYNLLYLSSPDKPRFKIERTSFKGSPIFGGISNMDKIYDNGMTFFMHVSS